MNLKLFMSQIIHLQQILQRILSRKTESYHILNQVLGIQSNLSIFGKVQFMQPIDILLELLNKLQKHTSLLVIFHVSH